MNGSPGSTAGGAGRFSAHPRQRTAGAAVWLFRSCVDWQLLSRVRRTLGGAYHAGVLVPPLLRHTPEVRMAKRVWGLSKKKANYKPAPEPGVRCDRCTYMFPPLALGGCRLVRGLIQASATCDEFTARHAPEA